MNIRDNSGLSILELLVALSIVAVIAGGLAITTQFGVRVLDHTEELHIDNPRVILRSRLRTWLSRANPAGSLANLSVGFEGSEEGLRFTTFAAKGFAPESVALRIEIRLRQTSVDLSIEELDDDGGVLARHVRTLATNVRNLKVQYFDARAAQPGWVSNWDREGRLPALVQITAEPGSEPHWPEFSVRLVYAN